METIFDIEAATGASVREIDTLLDRDDLRTKYLPTMRGRRRRYTRENAYELAFVLVLMRHGMKPAAAVAYSDAFRKQISGPNSYFVFADDPTTGFGTFSDEITNIKNKLPGCDAYTIIDIDNIEKRIDNVFNAEADQA